MLGSTLSLRLGVKDGIVLGVELRFMLGVELGLKLGEEEGRRLGLELGPSLSDAAGPEEGEELGWLSLGLDDEVGDPSPPPPPPPGSGTVVGTLDRAPEATDGVCDGTTIVGFPLFVGEALVLLDPKPNGQADDEGAEEIEGTGEGLTLSLCTIGDNGDRELLGLSLPDTADDVEVGTGDSVGEFVVLGKKLGCGLFVGEFVVLGEKLGYPLLIKVGDEVLLGLELGCKEEDVGR